jgi:hypothetical protein
MPSACCFFRYNLPCGIEPTDVSPRSTSPINIEENSEQPHHNEAPQESNAQQPGPFRTKTFARLPKTAEETTTSPPAKRRNFIPSERGKFTASTVRKRQQKETTMDTEPQASQSTTSINDQSTVARQEPPQGQPYPSIMEPQPGPSSRECDLHTPPTSDNLQTTQSTYQECCVLYNPQLRDDSTLTKTSSPGFPSDFNWNENIPIEPPCPQNYIRPNFATTTPIFNYKISSIREFKIHLMHLNNQYSRKLRNANRPRYKRDLYELYLWERININNTFLRVRAALIKAALMKQLAGTFSRTGPSC